MSEDIYQAIKYLYKHKSTWMDEMKKAKRQVNKTLALVSPKFEQIIKGYGNIK